MNEPNGVSSWRSLDDLLSAYADGNINPLDLFAALIGLLDIVRPDVIYDRLPEQLRKEFVAHARTVAESQREIFNVVTKMPLPAEALESLRAWLGSLPP